MIKVLVVAVILGSTFVLVTVGAHPGSFFQHRLRLHRVRSPAIGRILCTEDRISGAQDAVISDWVFGALQMEFFLLYRVVVVACDIIIVYCAKVTGIQYLSTL